jgi:hypothetical protein
MPRLGSRCASSPKKSCRRFAKEQENCRSEEGQRIYAQAGETPPHPSVDPVEKVRPAAAYMLGQDDVKEFPKYEKIWKEIFQIR